MAHIVYATNGDLVESISVIMPGMWPVAPSRDRRQRGYVRQNVGELHKGSHALASVATIHALASVATVK
jgi:hypothetical protein